MINTVLYFGGIFLTNFIVVFIFNLALKIVNNFTKKSKIDLISVLKNTLKMSIPISISVALTTLLFDKLIINDDVLSYSFTIPLIITLINYLFTNLVTGAGFKFDLNEILSEHIKNMVILISYLPMHDVGLIGNSYLDYDAAGKS